MDESPDRFRWLYRENPAGEARIWILHAPTGEAIGFTSGYPRAFWVAGREYMALNCGDFSVASAHRSLGPALMLRRPAKNVVDKGEFAFLYAHPVPAMLAVHRRVGHPQLSVFRRWAYPLRVAGILERRLGRHFAAVLAPIADSSLLARRRLQSMFARRFAVSEASDVSSAYDELDLRLGKHYSVIGRRTEAFLRWRFFRQPGSARIVLEARAEDRLEGYLILEPGSPTAKVKDMAFVPGLGVERALLLAAARRAAASGAQSLTVVAQRGYPGTAELENLGFWERDEEQSTVCYGGSGFSGKSRVEDAASWFMTVGDRDI